MNWTSRWEADGESKGHNLLHWATDGAYLDSHNFAPPDVAIVTALLDIGIQPSSRGARQDTPLHLIVRKPTPTSNEIIKILIDAGADVNAQNEQGYTPLHDAAEWGANEHADILLQHGARHDVKNRQNRLSSDLASLTGHASIASLITTAPPISTPAIMEPQSPPLPEKGKDLNALKRVNGFFFFFGTKQLSNRSKQVASVYDMLYGDVLSPDKIEKPSRPVSLLCMESLTVGCKRWIHLPANNVCISTPSSDQH